MILRNAVTGKPTPIICILKCNKKDYCLLKYRMKYCNDREVDKLVISEVERKGDWCETYTGKKFWTLDPRPYEICIEDIAHALSQICRYGGHCKHFYSVAQHSVIVSQELKKAGYSDLTQLYGLLHDASEAYICDLPRPIKRCMERYTVYEQTIQLAVYKSIGISPPAQQQQAYVSYMDNEVLYNEAVRLICNTNNWAVPSKRLDIDVSYKITTDVEGDFLSLYESLIKLV